MSKKIAILLLVLTLLVGTTGTIEAKKKLPVSTKTTTTAVASKPTISVRIRGDRRAIIASFNSLTTASSVSYSLSYVSRGIGQGVGGSMPTTSNSASREIIFGTCSGGVCRYDSGITDAKFVVTSTLKNGRKVIKTFRIKI